jgi:hypothetical protein
MPYQVGILRRPNQPAGFVNLTDTFDDQENKYFKPHFANFRKYRGTEFLDKKVWVNSSWVLDGQ